MRYAVNVPNFGDYADPRFVADLARDAEDAGWDGLFVWDHVTFSRAQPVPLADPWVLLTAVALATGRLRLGPMVTPLARRRMSTLARQTTTVDRLSGGRLVQGVGLGAPADDEYGAFGETTDARELGARLDESLEVLTRLWSGEPVTYAGEHLRVEGVTFLPTPVQRPRIPVWVAGTWPLPKPFRRAARWDGVVPMLQSQAPLSPEQTASVHAAVAARRPAGAGPFDLAVGGQSASAGECGDLAGAQQAAGATWWQEWLGPWRGSTDEVRARVRQGPAR